MEVNFNYPHCPKALDVFWDNGQWVAIVTDADGRRGNVALAAHSRREAILQGREALGLETEAYRRAESYR